MLSSKNVLVHNSEKLIVYPQEYSPDLSQTFEMKFGLLDE